MIHVDRGEPPAILNSSRAKLALEKAASFFRREPDKRRQESFNFDDLWLSPEVRKALAERFHNKCAFCETPLSGAAWSVEHFRPKTHTVGAKGEIDPDHYWWLFLEWENLYAACANCNRHKGSRFPLRGPRAASETPYADLASEQPLLLDPCHDDPAEHLVFAEDGTVFSETERGRTSIEVLGLNRTTLVEARAETYAAFDALRNAHAAAVRMGDHEVAVEIVAQLEARAAAGQPMSAVHRQFLSQWMRKAPDGTKVALADWMERPARPAAAYSKKARKRGVREFRQQQRAEEDFSVENQADDERYFKRTYLIEKIEISNFRVVRGAELQLSAGTGEGGPWCMLLGENGTGKSTVLQAAALAMMGKSAREKTGLQPDDVLRYRARRGYVRVHLSGSTTPIELTFRRGETSFGGTADQPRVLLLGYGATRFLPSASNELERWFTDPAHEMVRVENLFNPLVPLVNAERWLLSLTPETFDSVALSLKGLLSLHDTDEIIRAPRRRPREVQVRMAGTRMSLASLSAGYQSVLSLTADIMAVMLSRWPSMQVAEGIVLLDEIGLHLHPRWQMKIVKSLRGVFPRIQFVVSTHSPLCLRGVLNGEVIVARREGDCVMFVDDLPPVEGMRVDQLLTSEHFGLNSTLDPDQDREFQEYYHLLTLRDRTPEQEARLAELKERLARIQMLGSTRRERIMLEHVDEYLAQKPELLEPDRKAQLKEETRRKFAEIFSQA